MDSILAKQAELAERELHFSEPGLDVVDPLLTEARERANGERGSNPTREELACALRALDYTLMLAELLRDEWQEARELARNLRLACDERDAEIDRLLRDGFERQQSGGLA